jgi:hypothetical protein
VSLEGAPELGVAIYEALRTIKYRKELICGSLVKQTLEEIYPKKRELTPGVSVDFGQLGNLGVLLGIDVIVNDDMDEGAWRLIRHDACTVDNGSVSHSGCTILTSGEIRERRIDNGTTDR